ncbi:MAG: putative rane-bound dehydrogenase domain protein [Verrucomicrobiaceae bacterium]|nr:putative rane-bound dehydrogenase domain protein [Verrucomicrobiaceae bacterium]
MLRPFLIALLIAGVPAFAAKPPKTAKAPKGAEETQAASFMGSTTASNGPYVLESLAMPSGVKVEASGLATMTDGRLAVSTRNGDVWLFKMDGSPAQRFASGLHEPLGLAFHEGALYATQRSEVTCMRDTDGDGVADEYSTYAKGWGVSGNYHEYAYGPVFDPKGTAWITLNIGLGPHWEAAMPKDEHARWRGWCLTIPPGGGKLIPMACGLRSPCGIGTNLDGDVFGSDQQGNWWPAGPLLHLRKGAFFGHAESLPDAKSPDSPVKDPGKVPEEITIAQAIHQVPGYVPPAVWFPYVKMGQSCTGVICDSTNGKFGPFAGQMLVGEFVIAGINRVFLEKVGGEYQGACFPFLTAFDCAVLQMAFLPDGSLAAGETNRGWNSLGTRSFGVQRVKWTGETPFEVLKMEATKEGFRFTFTQPVQLASAVAESFAATSYTFLYHSKYGSPEVETQPVMVKSLKLDEDKRSLTVDCESLREGFVHEFHLEGIRSSQGKPLLHTQACYNLNRRP